MSSVGGVCTSDGAGVGRENDSRVGSSVAVLDGDGVGSPSISFVGWYVGSLDGVFSISSTRLGALELGVFGTGVGSACGHP
jgi:hypothetical protein